MTAPRHPSPRLLWSGLAALILLGAAVILVTANPETDPHDDMPAIVPAPIDVYDPVAAGEELPVGYRPLLDRDQIEPVYNPVFTSADAVDWPSDSLVIGVSSDRAAKAYPVTHLNSHEMVIDSIAGIPILVTW